MSSSSTDDYNNFIERFKVFEKRMRQGVYKDDDYDEVALAEKLLVSMIASQAFIDSPFENIVDSAFSAANIFIKKRQLIWEKRFEERWNKESKDAKG